MPDPRIAPVEDNLIAFMGLMGTSAMFPRHAEADVLALSSDIAFPLFNAVGGARFDADAAARTREVATAYLDRGLPWMWWLTPSTTSPALESTLEDLGLVREPAIGMYAGLDDAVAQPVPDVETSEVSMDDPDHLDTMMAGFDMPDFLRAPFEKLVAGLEHGDIVNVLSRIDGRPVGCGTAFITGGTAGLYNIATRSDARGRGVGYAVTAALMAAGRARGCTEAILHASEMGRPVYERLGFVEVCETPRYVWVPD